MSENSGIEWTDHTFNPWWGCQKVSPGCEHCYAETLANRFGRGIWGPPHATDRRLFGGKHWAEPLKWDRRAEREGRRARVFCASMADVFEDHPQVEDARHRLWRLIEATPRLDWQLLTKRPEHVRRMVPGTWLDGWPPNVWLGTSVEDQQRADERIPALLDTPAAVRFLSCEPLLGPVDLVAPVAKWMGTVPDTNRADLHWVIVGGESGPEARPMHPAWVRTLRDQCVPAGIPFFFKQWGAWTPSRGRSDEQVLMWPDGTHRPDTGPPYTPPGWTNLERVGKKAAGRELDGRTWDEFPQVVAA